MTQALQLLSQLPTTVVDDRVDASSDHRLDLMSQFHPARNTQYRSCPHLINHICSMDAADEFKNSPVFSRRHLPANVTGASIAGEWNRLDDGIHKDLRRGQPVLHCSQPPRVKTTQVVDVLFRMKLKVRRLILLQKAAEGASLFEKHFQDRWVYDDLPLCSHQSISAVTEPPHTARSPRIRLLTA